MTGGRRRRVRTVWRCRTAYRSAAIGLGNGLSCLRCLPIMAAPSGIVAVSIASRPDAGASAFRSPFGMTYTLRREGADDANSGASRLRDVLVLLGSTERSLSEIQWVTEIP